MEIHELLAGLVTTPIRGFVLMAVTLAIAADTSAQSVSKTQEHDAHSVADPFSITISVPQATFKVGDEIVVGIRLNNTGNQPLRIHGIKDVPGTVTNYEVDVRDTKGKIVEKRKMPESKVVVEDAYGALIRPGRWEYRFILLDKYWELDKPGKYKVWVQRTNPASGLTAKSNVLEFEIIE
jgi:hypothetical protein